jgi:hypothetical protein
MIVLAVASRPRRAESLPASRPIEDWSIVELVEHLNRMGVEVRLRSTQEDGTLGQAVYLTTIDKEWIALNRLNKDKNRINEWHGVIYCERTGQYMSSVFQLWGDHRLVVGPFLFYGDAELLNRVRAALAPFAPAAP